MANPSLSKSALSSAFFYDLQLKRFKMVAIPVPRTHLTVSILPTWPVKPKILRIKLYKHTIKPKLGNIRNIKICRQTIYRKDLIAQIMKEALMKSVEGKKRFSSSREALAPE